MKIRCVANCHGSVDIYQISAHCTAHIPNRSATKDRPPTMMPPNAAAVGIYRANSFSMTLSLEPRIVYEATTQQSVNTHLIAGQNMRNGVTKHGM
jgi:hypothetical protein